MKSKRYCPSCGSFQIHRVKRGVLQKHLFKQSPKYKCVHCFAVTSRNRLEKNMLAYQPGLFKTVEEKSDNTIVTCNDKFKDCA
jgi:transposase-like protein